MDTSIRKYWDHAHSSTAETRSQEFLKVSRLSFIKRMDGNQSYIIILGSTRLVTGKASRRASQTCCPLCPARPPNISRTRACPNSCPCGLRQSVNPSVNRSKVPPAGRETEFSSSRMIFEHAHRLSGGLRKSSGRFHPHPEAGAVHVLPGQNRNFHWHSPEYQAGR